MISPELFFSAIQNCGISFFAGVPDSLLADFCAYIDDQCSDDQHLITANEGNAIAVAAGYHLSSGYYPAVYMQNSGLGNCINPLTSLTDKEVYRIPMLMLIGWRGEPGVKDEPQHVKQGRITPAQLDILEIPYWVLDKDANYKDVLRTAVTTMKEKGEPVAILVRKGTFSKYKSARDQAIRAVLNREEALNMILSLVGDSLVISTTGKTSREVFELRKSRNEPQQDFLTVGGMGHTASIALGVAIGNPDKQVVCVDGDGSVLMHLGALPIIGSVKPDKLFHILLNNAAHESVGGQPTVAGQVDFEKLAKAAGYTHYWKADSLEEITKAWDEYQASKGLGMMEVSITIGSRVDLGRPTSTPEKNKLAFIHAARG